MKHSSLIHKSKLIKRIAEELDTYDNESLAKFATDILQIKINALDNGSVFGVEKIDGQL